MNYALQCQLLSEGFKHEQIIQEDWEKQKKELRDLYVAGKITERQISTRLARAGMGSLSKNAAYQIAHDPDNVQQREIALQRIKDAEEEKAKRAALAAQAAKHQTRGSTAQAYCNMWNQKFGHIVKAGVVKESLGIALVNKGLICEDSVIDDFFANLYGEVNYIGEDNMTEDVMIGIMESVLEEDIVSSFRDGKFKMKREKTPYGTEKYTKTNAKTPQEKEELRAKFAEAGKKAKSRIKKGAAILGATAALGAAPGIVSGAKNVKRQADYRAMDKTGSAYNYQMKQDEINAKQNEIAQKIHNTGVTFKNNVEDSAKCFSEVSKICKAFADNPRDPEIDSRVQDCIDKYGADAYIKSLNAIIAKNQATAATKSAAKKLASKVKGKFNKNTQVNEEFELIEEEVSVNKVEKKLAKMKKLLNKPRNLADSSFKDFSASEKEKMLSLIAEVEKVLARKPKTEAEVEKFQEDLESAFKKFNAHSKACKAFRTISWWFLPLGYIPPLTRLYSRMLRNLSNQRPIREEVNYFDY